MELFIAALFSALVLASCFVVAVFGKKWNLDVFMAFSSGGLITIAVLEFIPLSFEQVLLAEHGSHHDSLAPLLILAGIFIQGFFEVYLLPRLSFLDKFIEGQHKHSHSKDHHHSHLFSPATTCSVAACLSICSFFDGIRFFAALSIGGSVALVTGLALFFHLLSEGAFVTIIGLGSKIKLKVIVVLSFFISGTFIMGALFAKYFSDYFQSQNLVALATGILLYVCFIHLIPFSLKTKHRHWFFIGFIGFFIFHLFAH